MALTRALDENNIEAHFVAWSYGGEVNRVEKRNTKAFNYLDLDPIFDIPPQYHHQGPRCR